MAAVKGPNYSIRDVISMIKKSINDAIDETPSTQAIVEVDLNAHKREIFSDPNVMPQIQTSCKASGWSDASFDVKNCKLTLYAVGTATDN